MANVALAGTGLEVRGLLPARTSEWIATADVVFGLAVAAPQSPEECARELARRAEAGERCVLVTPGDPLASAFGAAVGQTLTAIGVDWEYLPAPDDSACARPGAVAHVARDAVGSDAEWEAWRARHALLGLRVVVTRAAHQSASLVEALARRGAEPIPCPTIEIADPEDFGPLDSAVGALGGYDWAVFTSANGVERFFERLAATGGDIRDLKGVRLAAIGPATARAVAARHLRVDLVPEEYVAESLFSALSNAGPLENLRVLIARAAVARDVLPDALRDAGAHVDVVDAYRTVRPDGGRELLSTLLESGRADLVTFTSSSTVTNFVALVGPELARVARGASIGPVTTATARDLGVDIAVEAAEYTVPGLVAAIERWAAGHIYSTGSGSDRVDPER
jgi:uroporphyrinogen-III synthase